MKISFGSWAFTYGPYADRPVPFETVCRRLAGAGYDGVEITGFSPHVSLDEYPTAASRRAVAGMLEDLGLGVSGYAADLTSVNPTAAGNRQRYLDLFSRNVEVCADVGSPSIRVDTTSAPGSLEEPDYEAALERLAEAWHTAAGLAGAAGVRVVWEFEPCFVFNKPSEVIALHDRVDHPNFRLLFDASHAYMCAVAGARQHGRREALKGGAAELARKLGKRIGSVHLIDSDGTLYGGETSTHRPFGEGKIDFEELAPLLVQIPDVEWWCVDLCFWAGAWDLVEPSLAFVRGLLARHSPA